LRVISHNALHDQAYKSNINREELVKRLSEILPVLISSEEELPGALKKYALHIPPSLLHHAMAKAELVISEGATVASEAALLGTPALYHYMRFGYLDELENKFQLLKYCGDTDSLIHKAIEIINDPASRNNQAKKLEKFFAENINVKDFIVWFVENWPDSKAQLAKDTALPDRFKCKLP
jgi:predicted glycosyltransferase